MKQHRSLNRLVAFLVCAVLAASLLSTAALAVGPGETGDGYECLYVGAVIDRSQLQMCRLELMVDDANARIELYVRIAQCTPYDDVDWLLAKVDETVAPVFAYAAAIGATVICEYVEYTIDSRTVQIDPIRIIKH